MTSVNSVLLQVTHQYDPTDTTGVVVIPLPWTAQWLNETGGSIRPISDGTLIRWRPTGSSPGYLDFAVQLKNPEMLAATQFPEADPNYPTLRRVWIWDLTSAAASPTKCCVATPSRLPEQLLSQYTEHGLTQLEQENDFLCLLRPHTFRMQHIDGILRFDATPTSKQQQQMTIPARTYTPSYRLPTRRTGPNGGFTANQSINPTIESTIQTITFSRTEVDNKTAFLFTANNSIPIQLRPSHRFTLTNTSPDLSVVLPNPRIDQLNNPVEINYRLDHQ